MVDVFISYSRRDQATVATLARAIEAEGYDVWWDAELPPHQSYGDVITAKIAESKAAVVVWSEDAVASEWVRAEADMARNQRKLIQTSLNRAMPPLPFNQIQYAELDNWQGEADHPGWRKVKLSLAELCGARDAAPAAASAPSVFPPPSAPSQPPVAQPPQPASRWPLYAGIGVGAAALAVAAGMLLGQRGDVPTPAATSTPPSSVAAVPAPALTPAAVVAAPEPVEGDARAAAKGEEEDAPLPPDPAGMTIPDSSTRLITEAEITSMGPSTLKIARNEIYARKGRRFKDASLREWFSRYAWYRPRFDEVKLNPVEQRNVALLQQAETRFGQ